MESPKQILLPALLGPLALGRQQQAGCAELC